MVGIRGGTTTIYDPPIYDITSGWRVAALFSREALNFSKPSSQESITYHRFAILNELGKEKPLAIINYI